MVACEYWAQRSLFVAGHTRLPGAAFALLARRLGAEVTGFGPSPDHAGAFFCRADVADETFDVRGDLTDAAMLDGALRSAEPEIVFHFVQQGEDPQILADLIDSIAAAPSVEALALVSFDSAVPRVPAAGGVRVAHCRVDGAAGFGMTPADPARALALLDGLTGVLEAVEREIPGASHFEFSSAGLRDNSPFAWAPSLSPAAAMEWNGRWMRALAAESDMRALAREQIGAFLAGRPGPSGARASGAADHIRRIAA